MTIIHIEPWGMDEDKVLACVTQGTDMNSVFEKIHEMYPNTHWRSARAGEHEYVARNCPYTAGNMDYVFVRMEEGEREAEVNKDNKMANEAARAVFPADFNERQSLLFKSLHELGIEPPVRDFVQVLNDCARQIPAGMHAAYVVSASMRPFTFGTLVRDLFNVGGGSGIMPSHNDASAFAIGESVLLFTSDQLDILRLIIRAMNENIIVYSVESIKQEVVSEIPF